MGVSTPKMGEAECSERPHDTADFEIRRRRFRAVSRKQRSAVTGLNRREFSIFSMHFFDLSSPTTQIMILCVFALLKSKKHR